LNNYFLNKLTGGKEDSMRIEIERMGELVLCDARVNSDFLNDPVKLEQVCLDSLKKGDCNIIEDQKLFYQFKQRDGHGDGVTGLIIIKESHFHISTWPDNPNFKYVQIDINTCGHTAKSLITLGHILNSLRVIKCSIQVIERGIPLYS